MSEETQEMKPADGAAQVSAAPSHVTVKVVRRPYELEIDIDRLSWGDVQKLFEMVGDGETQNPEASHEMLDLLRKCVVKPEGELPASALMPVINTVMSEFNFSLPERTKN